MVDIEHKSLKILQQNLSQLDFFVLQKERIKQIIIGDISYIDEWNESLRLELYKKICLDILNNYDINEIHFNLANLKDLCTTEKDINLNLIYSVLIAFFSFFNQIYEMFLLDQILFLLMNFSQEELIKPEVVLQVHQTNSYFESINFGLDFEHEKIKFIYCTKMECIRIIKRLLSIPEYLEKINILNKTLEEYISNGQDNYYANRIFIALNDTINRGMERKRVKNKIKNVNEI